MGNSNLINPHIGLPLSALKFGGTGYKFLQFRAGESLSVDSCAQTMFQIASLLLLSVAPPPTVPLLTISSVSSIGDIVHTIQL